MARVSKQEYDADIQVRSDGWIIISFPDVPGVTTQCATMHDVDASARHLLGQWFECNPDSFEIHVTRLS